jgi:hypothetical protein
MEGTFSNCRLSEEVLNPNMEAGQLNFKKPLECQNLLPVLSKIVSCETQPETSSLIFLLRKINYHIVLHTVY